MKLFFTKKELKLKRKRVIGMVACMADTSSGHGLKKFNLKFLL